MQKTPAARRVEVVGPGSSAPVLETSIVTKSKTTTTALKTSRTRKPEPAGEAPNTTTSSAVAGAASPAPAVSGKLALLVDLLRRPEGARIADMMGATGWQAHSVRGAMAGALKKKHGLAIVSEKNEAGRVYRVPTKVQA